MNSNRKTELYRQLMWDYTISEKEIEDVFSGRKEFAGHYNRFTLFRKILETYSWFTILQIFSIEELTEEVIKSLRMASLRKQYEFVQKRLQEVIPVTG